MDPLFLMQFACFIFMVINAMILAVTHLHVRWVNKRYERSRWMIFTALSGMAMQYLLQMCYGFRAKDDDLGAVVNILIYTPCFTLISLGIYNVEATHAHHKKMNQVCAAFFTAIIVTFLLGYTSTGSLHIGHWLYAMLALFGGSVVYCTCMITREIIRRKRMLETLTDTDMLPYVRYARASVFVLLFASLIMPFAILYTPVLLVVGPLALLSMLFFNLSFVALGNSYSPAEELLDREEEWKEKTKSDRKNTNFKHCGSQNAEETNTSRATESATCLSDEGKTYIEEILNRWCAEGGYKDSSVNMLTLSRTLRVSKTDLSQFFDQCRHTTFRIWLSEKRFSAAKQMMSDYPDYSNDIISAECGFSSRSYLYRIFKEKEGCTPTVWRERMSGKLDS